MEGTSDCSLVAAFAGLLDPRQSAKVLYPLPEIMLLLLCATLAGADDFVEIAVWGEQNLGFLRRLLPFQHGIPSHERLLSNFIASELQWTASYSKNTGTISVA